MSTGVPHVLALDDDSDILSQIARALGGYYKVLPHSNPTRALATLEVDSEIKVFVTEQIMRFGSGLELLQTVRSCRPDVRRVMITNYSDLASIIPGVHSGTIQALAQKPATDDELCSAIDPRILQLRGAHVRRMSA